MSSWILKPRNLRRRADVQEVSGVADNAGGAGIGDRTPHDAALRQHHAGAHCCLSPACRSKRVSSGHAFKHPSADQSRIKETASVEAPPSKRRWAPSECHSHSAWHTRCAHSLQLRRRFAMQPCRHMVRGTAGEDRSLRQWRTAHDGSASHQAAGWLRAILLGPPLATTCRSCGCRGASGLLDCAGVHRVFLSRPRLNRNAVIEPFLLLCRSCGRCGSSGRGWTTRSSGCCGRNSSRPPASARRTRRTQGCCRRCGSEGRVIISCFRELETLCGSCRRCSFEGSRIITYIAEFFAPCSARRICSLPLLSPLALADADTAAPC